MLRGSIFVFAFFFATHLFAIPDLNTIKGVSRLSPGLIYEERRKELSQENEVAQKIGKVVSESADHQRYMHCTGSMVGSDLVLTNAHCVVDGQNLYANITFYPGFRQTPSWGSKVVMVWKGSPESANDWAILRLGSPLGEKTGFFESLMPPLQDMTSSAWQKLVAFAGYNIDFKNGELPSLDNACTILGKDAQGSLRNNCNYTLLGSGSPLLIHTQGKTKVVALAWGERRDLGPNGYNLAVDAVNYHPTLSRLLVSPEGVPADPSFHLCHHGSPKEVTVDLVYLGVGGQYLLSRGEVIPPNQCIERALPAGTKDVYVYAQDGAQQWKGNGSDQFCFSDPHGSQAIEPPCLKGQRLRSMIRWTWDQPEQRRYREFTFLPDEKFASFRPVIPVDPPSAAQSKPASVENVVVQNYQSAMSQSRVNGKPVLVIYTTKNCSACQLLKRDLFSPRMARRLSRYNVALLDGSGLVETVPQIWFYDSSGRRLAEVIGYQNENSLGESLDHWGDSFPRRSK